MRKQGRFWVRVQKIELVTREEKDAVRHHLATYTFPLDNKHETFYASTKDLWDGLKGNASAEEALGEKLYGQFVDLCKDCFTQGCDEFMFDLTGR